MAQFSPSLKVFSETIEAIYDCALNPGRWRETLRLMGQLTHSTHVAVGTMDYIQKQMLNTVEYGYDPAYLKTNLEKYSVNPVLVLSHKAPIGAPYTLPMLGVLENYRKSEFYNSWIKPQRFGDLAGLNGLRSGGRVAALIAHRTLPQPDYGKRELQLMARLSPHICRTFAISDALGLKAIAAQAFEATLNSLATAVYLADRGGHVVFMNRAAEEQIKSSNVLRIFNTRLAPVSHVARTAMDVAIATAIANEAATAPGGTTLALPGSNGGGLLATVLPLDRGQRRDVSRSFAAAVAVFVQDPAISPTYPGKAFAKLYGLTGAELRVHLAMVPVLASRMLRPC